MSQSLITAAMLDDAAAALSGHQLSKRRCSCGAAPVTRHLAEVMAEAIAPALVAEIMALLGQVAASEKAAS